MSSFISVYSCFFLLVRGLWGFTNSEDFTVHLAKYLGCELYPVRYPDTTVQGEVLSGSFLFVFHEILCSQKFHCRIEKYYNWHRLTDRLKDAAAWCYFKQYSHPMVLIHDQIEEWPRMTRFSHGTSNVCKELYWYRQPYCCIYFKWIACSRKIER